MKSLSSLRKICQRQTVCMITAYQSAGTLNILLVIEAHLRCQRMAAVRASSIWSTQWAAVPSTFLTARASCCTQQWFKWRTMRKPCGLSCGV